MEPRSTRSGQGQASIREILTRRILTKDEPLFEEPLQLIRGESAIREPGNYYELLRAIARGATQFNQILHQSKISSGQLLSNRLDRLAKLCYIEERRPLAGNGSTSWSVSDPFFRFWFRYVYPNRSRLQRGRVEEVYEAILADIDNHMGPVFEQVCRDWAGRYSTDPPLAEAHDIGAYWTRTHDVEVDLVARGRQGILAVGACMFARDFHHNLTERAERDGVRLVSAAEQFAGTAPA